MLLPDAEDLGFRVSSVGFRIEGFRGGNTTALKGRARQAPRMRNNRQI